jgi:hypothetical protein
VGLFFFPAPMVSWARESLDILMGS